MASWSDLHAQSRYRPKYPNEHVVRWLARLPGHGLALDIGAGAGRHTKLLSEFGYAAVATDMSLEGLSHVPYASPVTIFRMTGRLSVGPKCVQSTMTTLPFKDESFDVALAYASLYYADRYWQAINEMWRVLKPGGHGFVSMRTDADNVPSRGEDGMWSWRLPETALATSFRDFSSFAYERCDTTRNERAEFDSEWLCEVRK